MYVYMHVCVCERERKKEKKSLKVDLHTHVLYSDTEASETMGVHGGGAGCGGGGRAWLLLRVVSRTDWRGLSVNHLIVTCTAGLNCQEKKKPLKSRVSFSEKPPCN